MYSTPPMLPIILASYCTYSHCIVLNISLLLFHCYYLAMVKSGDLSSKLSATILHYSQTILLNSSTVYHVFHILPVHTLRWIKLIRTTKLAKPRPLNPMAINSDGTTYLITRYITPLPPPPLPALQSTQQQ